MTPAAGILLTVATCAGCVALLAAAAPPPGDAAAGKLSYAKCIGCHSPDRNRTGPRHCELFGRVSGTLPGYDYSDAMRKAAILWNAEALDRFLASPTTVVPGTTMGFAGVADARERRNLVAYLGRLSASAEECNEAQKEN
jgi:cytochrome c